MALRDIDVSTEKYYLAVYGGCVFSSCLGWFGIGFSLFGYTTIKAMHIHIFQRSDKEDISSSAFVFYVQEITLQILNIN